MEWGAACMATLKGEDVQRWRDSNDGMHALMAMRVANARAEREAAEGKRRKITAAAGALTQQTVQTTPVERRQQRSVRAGGNKFDVMVPANSKAAAMTDEALGAAIMSAPDVRGGLAAVLGPLLQPVARSPANPRWESK